VGYAKSDPIVPHAPFADLVCASDMARDWCTEVNSVVHSGIAAVPAQRLLTEQGLLAPLPSLRLRLGTVVTHKVDRLSCVRFGSARYSVPTRLIGQAVEVRNSEGRLLILEIGSGELPPSTAWSRPARRR
jgi:hypothetical protein